MAFHLVKNKNNNKVSSSVVENKIKGYRLR